MKRASLKASLVVITTAIVLGGVIAGLLPSYWVFLATSVLVTGVALQSLGLVAGRTGMIALCQMSFAGVGAWTVGYLNLAEAPGGLPVWILIGGGLLFGVVLQHVIAPSVIYAAAGMALVLVGLVVLATERSRKVKI